MGTEQQPVATEFSNKAP